MSDAEGKLKKLETPGMYGIKMAHPSKAMFTPLPFEGKLFNVPFVEVDTRTDKVRKREGRKKEMVFDQQETYMVAGGKFVSINQVPGGDGDKYESDPYDHPSVRACVHTRLSAAQQRRAALSLRGAAATAAGCLAPGDRAEEEGCGGGGGDAHTDVCASPSTGAALLPHRAAPCRAALRHRSAHRLSLALSLSLSLTLSPLPPSSTPPTSRSSRSPGPPLPLARRTHRSAMSSLR